MKKYFALDETIFFPLIFLVIIAIILAIGFIFNFDGNYQEQITNGDVLECSDIWKQGSFETCYVLGNDAVFILTDEKKSSLG